MIILQVGREMVNHHPRIVGLERVQGVGHALEEKGHGSSIKLGPEQLDTAQEDSSSDCIARPSKYRVGIPKPEGEQWYGICHPGAARLL